MLARQILSSLLVCIISLLAGIVWNVWRGGIIANTALATSLCSLALGWILLIIYDRMFRQPVTRLFGVELQKNGSSRIRETLCLYAQLCRTRDGRLKMVLILSADYICYVMTQFVPLIISLEVISKISAEQAIAIAWPVLVASPILSLVLSFLIIISNRIFGVETPNSNAGP